MSDPALPKRTVSEQDLERLKKQREEADSRYDEALTRARCGALRQCPSCRIRRRRPTKRRVTPLNTRWEILRARPAAGAACAAGWRVFVWGLVEPFFAEQQAFNSARRRSHQPQHPPAARDGQVDRGDDRAAARSRSQQLVAFHSTLLQYLQRITPFVNSKDYEFASLSRRVYEDAEEEIQSLARTQRALSAAIQGLSDELLKQVESLKSHVQRYDGRIEGANAAVAVVQQQAAALQREVERLADERRPLPAKRPRALAVGRRACAGASRPPAAMAAHVVDAGRRFVARELEVSGVRRRRFAARRATSPIGWPATSRCSRRPATCSTSAAAAASSSTAARGPRHQRARHRPQPRDGRDLPGARPRRRARRRADAICASLPDESLGGLFAAQVVEHLPPDYLLAFLNEARACCGRARRSCSRPSTSPCWYAFFQSYIRDITHARPLHPDTLQISGHCERLRRCVEVEFRVPVAEADRLQRPPEIAWRPTGEDKDAIATLAKTMDDNATLLNGLLVHVAGLRGHRAEERRQPRITGGRSSRSRCL